jgi:conjugal transfer/entry exclusion protein
MAKNKSRKERLDEAAAAMRDKLGDVEAVKDELQEWFDNLSGTNFANSDRAGRIEEAASTLDDLVSTIESALDDIANIEVPTARD